MLGAGVLRVCAQCFIDSCDHDILEQGAGTQTSRYALFVPKIEWIQSQ